MLGTVTQSEECEVIGFGLSSTLLKRSYLEAPGGPVQGFPRREGSAWVFQGSEASVFGVEVSLR